MTSSVLRLMLVFAGLSALGFGGGNAITPQMYADAVDRYHWVTAIEFSRYFALARLAPGPAMTISALIGYRVDGFAGAVIAAIAMFLPAALIVFAIARLYDRFHEHPVRKIFARGMIPIVLGLTWVGVAVLSRGALESPLTYAFAAITAVVMLTTKINTSLVIAVFAGLGAIFLR